MSDQRQDLQARAKSIRTEILKMTTTAGSGHPTSSLSAVEMLVALYFGGFLKYDPQNPTWADRDRFILSKGHAAPALYAVLAEAGYFPKDQLSTLRKLDSPLEGHPNVKRMPAVEASTGSLGQGLSIGVGHALAAKIDSKSYHTYVLVGDGEIGQGQVWEAVASADKYHLANLTVIVDRNRYQQTGSALEVQNMDPIDAKFAAFGWHTQVIEGNDQEAVVEALKTARSITDRPTCIVSQTQKGYGILKLMESLGDMNFHGKPVPAEHLDAALAEVAAG